MSNNTNNSNNTKNFIQLQNICNQVTLSNLSNIPILAVFELLITTSSPPIGFSLTYTESNAIMIKSNTTSSLAKKPTTLDQSLNENKKSSVASQPDEIKLTVYLKLNSQGLNLPYLPINLTTSKNGQVSTSEATGIYGPLNLRTTVKLGYTFVKQNQIYKWTLLNINLIFTNKQSFTN